MRRGAHGLATACAIACIALACVWDVTRAQSRSPATSEWRVYGGPGQTRYSSLQQINRANVGRLQVAWTFDTHEEGGLQTSPLVVNGVLYGLTPTHKVMALDATTGQPRWTFDAGIVGRGPNRGLMYWTDGTRGRIFTGQGTFIYALDAVTGRPIPAFGSNGRIDLREGLGRDPDAQSILLTTPGVVYQDLMIVGGRASENLPASPGDIRAYAWRIPLGEYPELAAKGLANTGSENYGGPIVTAGGVVFIGATNFDRTFHAFDSRTGKLLWETTMPYSGNATPITYQADGRQFVVIAAGGGRNRPGTAQQSGGVYVAFALAR